MPSVQMIPPYTTVHPHALVRIDVRLGGNMVGLGLRGDMMLVWR